MIHPPPAPHDSPPPQLCAALYSEGSPWAAVASQWQAHDPHTTRLALGQQQQQQGQGQQQQGHEVECLAQRMVCGVAAGDSVKQLAGRLQLTKDRAADLLLSFTNCFQGAPPSLHRGCAPSPSLLSTLKP